MEGQVSIGYEDRERAMFANETAKATRLVAEPKVVRESSQVEEAMQQVQRGLAECFGRLELLTDRLRPVLIPVDEEKVPGFARYGDSPLAQELTGLASSTEYLAKRIHEVIDRLTL